MPDHAGDRSKRWDYRDGEASVRLAICPEPECLTAALVCAKAVLAGRVIWCGMAEPTAAGGFSSRLPGGRVPRAVAGWLRAGGRPGQVELSGVRRRG